MRQRQVEVLAPAGSFESMKAAVAAGADAVYIGGSRFGARAYADNLDQEKMLEAIDYAHVHGVSLYMTVNTLMKEEELGELPRFLKPYYEQGLDGVIVQDLGAVHVIRRYFPELPVHASTQMTITGAYGARILAGLGVKRVVTARELSLEEIRRIHEEVPIEIECFVHGALCYCYSGQCLLSSYIGGRSGNRGRCAQPCRLPYKADTADKSQKRPDDRQKRESGGKAAGGRKGKRDVTRDVSQKDSYILSMKDLCTLDLIPDLIEAGVDSLKIEGRMKSPRYTAGVVRAYRKYVDAYLERGREGYQVSEEDRQELLDLFDRGGFTQGYYRQHNGRDMIAVREKPAFRQGNQQLFDQLDRLYVEKEKKEPIEGILTVAEGQEVSLKLGLGKTSEGRREICEVTVLGQRAERAQNQAVTKEQLLRQIKKTGNTPFEWRKLDVRLEGQVFLPVQALNELRRQGLKQLEQAVTDKYRRTCSAPAENPEALPTWRQGEHGAAGAQEETDRKKPELHVLLPAGQGLSRILEIPQVSAVIAEADGFVPGMWKRQTALCHDRGKAYVLAMPMIFRKQAEGYFDRNLHFLQEAGFDGILVRALEEIDYLQRRGVKIPIYADHNLYSFNSAARDMLMQLGCRRTTFPLELNNRELKQLGGQERELIGYGFLPAMVSAQCVLRTVSGCSKKPGRLMMKDRTGKELPVENHCAYCYNIIYNPSPLSLIDQKDRIMEISPKAVRLQFTGESQEEICQVTKAWAAALYGTETEDSQHAEKSAHVSGDFTRGHFKRGVE